MYKKVLFLRVKKNEMKKLSFILMAFCGVSLLGASSYSSQKDETIEFKLGTGVNVSHWLSQSESRGEERANQISKKDFDKIAEMGFDHVRLPIDEEQFYDENLNRYEDAFVLLKNAIDWTLENNMNIVIDLHITRAHYFLTESENTLFTEPAAQQHMIDMWKDLQSFLKNYPNDRLAYELLNEAIAPTHEALNELEARLIAAIREQEPERFIVVGCNWQQTVAAMPYLKVPENDKHLIISFHYYNPLFITHYGAPWTAMKDFTGKVSYPGDIVADTSFFENLDPKILHQFRSEVGNWDKAYLLQQIQPSIDKGKELGLQVYCGEFGAYPYFIDKEPRLNWYKDICAIFRENNIANAHWCYKGDFPIVDEDLTPNEVAPILLGK